MKNHIFDYAVKTMKKNKKHSLVNVFLYSILTVFLISTMLLINSYIISVENEKIDTYGSQDAIILTNDLSDKQDVQSAAQDIGTVEYIGEFELQNDEAIETIYLGTCDAVAAQMASIYAVEGNLPTKAGEIAIEKTQYDKIKNIYSIGDEITLVSDGESYSYTLVGVIRNYSDLIWGNAIDKYSMPTAFIYQDEISQNESSLYFLTIDFTDDDFTSILDDYEMYVLNLVDQEYLQYTQAATMYSIFIVIPIVITLIILMLYAIYALGIYSMNKKISLLKIIGFKKIDTFLYYFYQYIFEIVPAAILGTLISLATFSFLISNFISFIEPEINIVIVILCLILIFVFSLVLLIISNNKANKASIIQSSKNIQSQTTPLTVKTTNPYVLYALKNFLLNKKQVNAIAISIFTAIVALSVGLTVSNSIILSQSDLSKADIELLTYDGSYYSSMLIDADTSYGISQEDFDLLDNLDETQEVIGIKSMINTFIVIEDSQNTEGTFGSTLETFEEDKAKFGLENTELIETGIMSIDSESLLSLQQYVIDGEIDSEKLEAGENILLIFNPETQTFDENEFGKTYVEYEVGQEINFTKIVLIDGVETRTNFTSEIGAILEIDTDDKNNDTLANMLYRQFVWDNSAFEAVGLELNYFKVLITVEDSSQITAINQEIYKLSQTYTTGYFESRQNLQEREATETISNSFKTLSYAVFISLAGFSTIFVFITIKKLLESRASLFGMMRACGMNKKSLNKLFIYQNLLILAFALALGLFSSVAVMLTMYFAFGQEEVLQAFPILEAILLSVFYVVSIVIAIVLPVSKFMKKTITECLRDE